MEENLEERPLIGYDEQLAKLRASKAGKFRYGWAKVDAIFWKSAIFTRDTMALNHVSPHKYGEKKALGIFRVTAACFLFFLFIFLTVYLSTMSRQRPYLTMVWWVFLGTLSFFIASLIEYKAYFGKKND